ncbi:SIR2 family NAD-dependent protein deacylase [Saccharothrix syringae]|uniref:SIR2 family NAD-dependent protein deacylase n=1 Tax=Saccharothrix syringae TaxID=103733 RepID=UPI000A0539BF|nr:Sir2 family NAD-dependent protein deacetylase [Saccharothrix syringae]
MSARDVMAVARRITVLTGAGVSAASGVHRFAPPVVGRGVGGREAGGHEADGAAVAWRSWLDDPMWTAEPNAAHRALAELERAGRVRALLTQNVDGLHQRAGSSAVELHGSAARVVCVDCGAGAATSWALAEVRAGAGEPRCPLCGGALRPATVAFGEPLADDVLRVARAAALDCDAVLAAGTSLTVEPGASLVGLAVRAGAALVVCNLTPTPYDDVAAAVVREPVEESLPVLVAVPVVASGPIRTWGDPSTW